MLGEIYYMRDQLDRTAGRLGSTGRESGQQWFVDQGIGYVTPETLRDVVCPLLSNRSKTPVSLLAEPVQSAGHQAEPLEDEQEESSYAEGLGLPSLKVPGWLGGSADESSTEPATDVPVTAEPTVNQSTPQELPVSEEWDVISPPLAPVGEGCPAGSMQNVLLTKLATEFELMRKDDSLATIGSTNEDLLSIENGVMALYKYRGCPAVPQDEFKTIHVCELHREEQAKALRVLQSDVPETRSALLALQSRLKEIDGGTSKECTVLKTMVRGGRSMKAGAGPILRPSQLDWCLQLQSMIDGLLDGRPSQTQWLQDVGDGMQRLGTMSIQLSQHINDPVLKRDKIPLNALHALTRSWKHMQATVQHLRYKGSIHARQLVKMDVVVLQLTALLRNVSTDEQCISEGFRMRYSAQTCASLRLQLNAAAMAKQSDLDSLQDSVQKTLQTASQGLISNKCTATPTAGGCWVRMPTGCPNLKFWKSADKWTQDVFGEQSTGAAQSKTVCTVSRKIQMDHLCGVENTEMRFIAP